jgi:hypothetical protein
MRPNYTQNGEATQKILCYVCCKLQHRSPKTLTSKQWREKEEEYKERPETGSYVLNFKHLEKNY